MKRSRGLFRTGNRRKGQLLVRAAAVVVLWLAMVVVVAPTVARAEDNELWGDHWGFAANGGASATFADDRSVAHAGQASLKVTNGSGFAANVYGTVWQTFATKPNTTYDFHAGSDRAERRVRNSRSPVIGPSGSTRRMAITTGTR